METPPNSAVPPGAFEPPVRKKQQAAAMNQQVGPGQRLASALFGTPARFALTGMVMAAILVALILCHFLADSFGLGYWFLVIGGCVWALIGTGCIMVWGLAEGGERVDDVEAARRRRVAHHKANLLSHDQIELLGPGGQPFPASKWKGIARRVGLKLVALNGGKGGPEHLGKAGQDEPTAPPTFGWWWENALSSVIALSSRLDGCPHVLTPPSATTAADIEWQEVADAADEDSYDPEVVRGDPWFLSTVILLLQISAMRPKANPGASDASAEELHRFADVLDSEIQACGGRRKSIRHSVASSATANTNDTLDEDLAALAEEEARELDRGAIRRMMRSVRKLADVRGVPEAAEDREGRVAEVVATRETAAVMMESDLEAARAGKGDGGETEASFLALKRLVAASTSLAAIRSGAAVGGGAGATPTSHPRPPDNPRPAGLARPLGAVASELDEDDNPSPSIYTADNASNDESDEEDDDDEDYRAPSTGLSTTYTYNNNTPVVSSRQLLRATQDAMPTVALDIAAAGVAARMEVLADELQGAAQVAKDGGGDVGERRALEDALVRAIVAAKALAVAKEMPEAQAAGDLDLAGGYSSEARRAQAADSLEAELLAVRGGQGGEESYASRAELSRMCHAARQLAVAVGAEAPPPPPPSSRTPGSAPVPSATPTPTAPTTPTPPAEGGPDGEGSAAGAPATPPADPAPEPLVVDSSHVENIADMVLGAVEALRPGARLVSLTRGHHQFHAQDHDDGGSEVGTEAPTETDGAEASEFASVAGTDAVADSEVGALGGGVGEADLGPALEAAGSRLLATARALAASLGVASSFDGARAPGMGLGRSVSQVHTPATGRRSVDHLNVNTRIAATPDTSGPLARGPGGRPTHAAIEAALERDLQLVRARPGAPAPMDPEVVVRVSGLARSLAVLLGAPAVAFGPGGGGDAMERVTDILQGQLSAARRELAAAKAASKDPTPRPAVERLLAVARGLASVHGVQDAGAGPGHASTGRPPSVMRRDSTGRGAAVARVLGTDLGSEPPAARLEKVADMVQGELVTARNGSGGGAGGAAGAAWPEDLRQAAMRLLTSSRSLVAIYGVPEAAHGDFGARGMPPGPPALSRYVAMADAVQGELAHAESAGIVTSGEKVARDALRRLMESSRTLASVYGVPGAFGGRGSSSRLSMTAPMGGRSSTAATQGAAATGTRAQTAVSVAAMDALMGSPQGGGGLHMLSWEEVEVRVGDELVEMGARVSDESQSEPRRRAVMAMLQLASALDLLPEGPGANPRSQTWVAEEAEEEAEKLAVAFDDIGGEGVVVKTNMKVAGLASEVCDRLWGLLGVSAYVVTPCAPQWSGEEEVEDEYEGWAEEEEGGGVVRRPPPGLGYVAASMDNEFLVGRTLGAGKGVMGKAYSEIVDTLADREQMGGGGGEGGDIETGTPTGTGAGGGAELEGGGRVLIEGLESRPDVLWWDDEDEDPRVGEPGSRRGSMIVQPIIFGGASPALEEEGAGPGSREAMARGGAGDGLVGLLCVDTVSRGEKSFSEREHALIQHAAERVRGWMAQVASAENAVWDDLERSVSAAHAAAHKPPPPPPPPAPAPAPAADVPPVAASEADPAAAAGDAGSAAASASGTPGQSKPSTPSVFFGTAVALDDGALPCAPGDPEAEAVWMDTLEQVLEGRALRAKVERLLDNEAMSRDLSDLKETKKPPVRAVHVLGGVQIIVNASKVPKAGFSIPIADGDMSLVWRALRAEMVMHHEDDRKTLLSRMQRVGTEKTPKDEAGKAVGDVLDLVPYEKAKRVSRAVGACRQWLDLVDSLFLLEAQQAARKADRPWVHKLTVKPATPNDTEPGPPVEEEEPQLSPETAAIMAKVMMRQDAMRMAAKIKNQGAKKANLKSLSKAASRAATFKKKGK